MDEQQKKEQLTVQRITQSMLNEGKCVEELFHRLDRKGDEPFLHTYLRVVSDESGMIIDGRQYTHYEMILFFNSVDSPSEELELRLAKRVSMSDIEDYVGQYYGKRWKDFKFKEKQDILYGFGLDVKGGKRYYVDRITHRNRANKVVTGLCVAGSERIDKEWLTSGLASYEAKIFTTDGALNRDLMEMGRY